MEVLNEYYTTQKPGSGRAFFFAFAISVCVTHSGDEPMEQEGTELINIRTGLRGENWMLMLYGRNVTDESVANGGADVPLARGSHMRYLNRGEVFGIQAAWEF